MTPIAGVSLPYHSLLHFTRPQPATGPKDAARLIWDTMVLRLQQLEEGTYQSEYRRTNL